MKKRIPRILLAAGASGSGKTLLTCGLLQVLVNRGIKTVSFKCGPDYIDPMFHKTVLGTKSRNLDTFFTDGDTACYLMEKHGADCQIAVVEGVMEFMCRQRTNLLTKCSSPLQCNIPKAVQAVCVKGTPLQCTCHRPDISLHIFHLPVKIHKTAAFFHCGKSCIYCFLNSGTVPGGGSVASIGRKRRGHIV